jgi:hypothetical protein
MVWSRTVTVRFLCASHLVELIIMDAGKEPAVSHKNGGILIRNLGFFISPPFRQVVTPRKTTVNTHCRENLTFELYSFAAIVADAS